MSIGTFYSPWFPYTVASVYNVSDEVVISNCGYDLNYPQKDVLVPLAQVTKDIKRLDINHKITELTRISPLGLFTKLELMTQKEGNRYKNEYWADPRGIGLTAANEEAVRREANWIIKIDTDQAAYKDIYKLRHFLHVFPSNGLKFRQYEFAGDVGGTKHYFTSPLPSPYEDSIFVYKAIHGQYFGGAGSPSLHLPGQDRINTDVFHAAHLRSANPIWLTEEQKFQHFYGRCWFRNYTNKYARFGPELDKQSKDDAYRLLDNGNKKLTDCAPPEVCMYQDPLQYIKYGSEAAHK
jgi:hypothetical protein